VLAALVVITGYSVYSVNQNIRNSYAVWWVADMVIEHLRANDNQWPDSWEDLRDDYRTCVDRSGQAWQFEELRSRVSVDFNVDSHALNAAVQQATEAEFRVIWLSDGSTVHWQSHEPNSMVFNYFKGVTSIEPVHTGFGGNAPGKQTPHQN